MSVAAPSGDTVTQHTNVGVAETLASGQTGTATEGVYAPASFTTHVYTDANGDSSQDNGEANLAGVTVALENASGTVAATATTNASGNVSFTGLVPGAYQVAVTTPSGDVVTQHTNVATVDTLASGQTAMATEGVVAPASFTTHVYSDANGDNSQESGEANLAGVTVDLLTGNGVATGQTAVTDANGNVTFSGLVPGSYEVAVVTPTGDTVTQHTNIGTAVTLAAGATATATEGLHAASGIEVTKLPGSVVISAGGSETYTYDVTNTGSQPLGDITVVDNIGTVANPINVTASPVLSSGYNAGDTNHDGVLEPGETWQYTATVNEAGVSGGSSCTSTQHLSNCGLQAGKTAWLSSCFTPTSTANGACYAFNNVQVSIANTGGAPITENCGNAIVTFSSSCTSATTTWSASQNCWITTLPAGQNCGNVFLTGVPVQVPSGCDLSNASVTWTIGSSGNNCGSSSLSWHTSACGFNNFDQNGCYGSSNYN